MKGGRKTIHKLAQWGEEMKGGRFWALGAQVTRYAVVENMQAYTRCGLSRILVVNFMDAKWIGMAIIFLLGMILRLEIGKRR